MNLQSFYLSQSRAKVVILITYSQVKYHTFVIIQMMSPLLKSPYMSFKYYQIDTAEHTVFVFFKQHIFLNSLYSLLAYAQNIHCVFS